MTARATAIGVEGASCAPLGRVALDAAVSRAVWAARTASWWSRSDRSRSRSARAV